MIRPPDKRWITGFGGGLGDTLLVEFVLQLDIDDTVAVDDAEDDTVAEEARDHDEPCTCTPVRWDLASGRVHGLAGVSQGLAAPTPTEARVNHGDHGYSECVLPTTALQAAVVGEAGAADV
ncbi:hypothetical protein J6590_008325 [Homalodisca vitripennis]|nr:hypothetical protein J6590_008325 [Homalodisca vitripennis]